MLLFELEADYEVSTEDCQITMHGGLLWLMLHSRVSPSSVRPLLSVQLHADAEQAQVGLVDTLGG